MSLTPASSQKKSRILVVEDEADIRDFMIMHLGREGYEPAFAEDGEKAVRLLEKNKYDLAVLDWMLPGISGLDICKKINGKMPVLMVTAKADVADIVLGLEMGADDYLTKPFETPIFLARIRALLRRLQAPKKRTADWYNVGNLKVALDEHQVWCGKEEVQLTISEFKLLLALLEHKGKVLSRNRLISLVQGDGVAVIDRTIDTHVFGLRKKLGECADVIETIRGVGYRVKA